MAISVWEDDVNLDGLSFLLLSGVNSHSPKSLTKDVQVLLRYVGLEWTFFS